MSQRGKSRRQGDLQLTLFGPADHPLLDAIREVDVDGTAPLSALQLIKEWQEELKRES